MKQYAGWWKKRSETERKVLTVSGIAAAGLLLYAFWPKNQTGGISENPENINFQNLTYPKDAYKVYADALEAAFWGIGGVVKWWEDDEKVGEILRAMYNIDDVLYLAKTYGRRYVGVVIQNGGNLAETVTELLDQDIKDNVNQVYSQRNIPFVWL